MSGLCVGSRMRSTALIALACLVTLTSLGQTNEEQRRTARRARDERLIAIEKRIAETRPQRRDSPLRYENIRDNEVRQIQAAALQVVPKAIVNISGVVTGCPCEEGPSCSDQVWILAHSPQETVGLELSKINNRWTIGAIQSWWLEYEKLQARRDSFPSTYDYIDAEEVLELRFPMCASVSSQP